MSNIFEINNTALTFDDLKYLYYDHQVKIKLSTEAIEKINACRQYLDGKLSDQTALHYGINTGFGSLCNVRINPDQINTLQENLIQSHAVGMGDKAPDDVVRLMLILKIKSLAQGYSGVCLATIERLIELFNSKLYPVVYKQGSLGASGDLAPLAHLSLPIIGQGEISYNGNIFKTEEIIKSKGIKPLKLSAKEGLALLNGTQFCTAYAVYAMLKADELLTLSSLNAAVGVDAFMCHLTPFDARLHHIRPHSGQQKIANQILKILEGSEISQQPKDYVQDPYAFRCIPQVHGASLEALEYSRKIILTEANAVTDNPNIFPDSDAILSGGNFHAQPIALVADFMAIALSELGSISERRIYQYISGQRSLPAFLTPDPGLHSGLMIAQYTAASIASQNKQLCTPASVDSIISCNGQEDHVSMGANAVTKLYTVVDNLFSILSIEFMVACQALSFRLPLRSSELIDELLGKYRKVVPFLDDDRVLFTDIRETKNFLGDYIKDNAF
ncbi:MAG: histidine ammonia-lyase [Saprospiraceae bacterium]|nr:histidine ammonia-lyase [Saprospiraceae bacterium]